MQLSKRLHVGLAIRLEDNSGERVLNALKFIDAFKRDLKTHYFCFPPA